MTHPPTLPSANSGRTSHQPVLADEVMTHLNLTPKTNIIDGTVGLGGHAAAILSRTKGKLLGLDRDAASLALAAEQLTPFGDRVLLKQGNFADLAELTPADFGSVDGIVLDLGISSWQLAERGFSFLTDQPLDFRMDTRETVTAAQLVAELKEKELADILYQYGEERRSRRIAKAIVRARKQAPIVTTKQLADLIEQAAGRRGRLHPATKSFQALRIAVNDELGSLKRGLSQAEQVLAGGGRLAVITFHSLEDRIVKEFLKGSTKLRIINKKVITPTRPEVLANPRARSAKLRVAEKITGNS